MNEIHYMCTNESRKRIMYKLLYQNETRNNLNRLKKATKPFSHVLIHGNLTNFLN